MKKPLVFLTALALLIGLAGLPVSAQDDQAKKMEEGKKLLDKWIGAQGGRDNLIKIKDTTSSGTMELISLGAGGTVSLYQKEPDKLRMDIEISGLMITQAFNGEIGWMTNPQTGVTEKMPDQFMDDLKRQAMGNDTLLNPDKYGITFTLEGQESVGGKNYLILKQIFEDGFENSFYIDPETNLVYKTVAMAMSPMGVEVETETFMSDYHEVEGTMVPFSITVTQDGEEYMSMSILEVKYNSGLEDSFFDME
jgi:outer membrane lipoprotein-sorting protein